MGDGNLRAQSGLLGEGIYCVSCFLYRMFFNMRVGFCKLYGCAIYYFGGNIIYAVLLFSFPAQK